MYQNMSDFTRKIFTIILPITFQQFMLALVSASDALMLGLLNQDALSAVSLAGQVAFVESLFLFAISSGLSMLAAQYWGKKDIVSVEKISAYIMKITAVISFLFTIISLVFPHLIMQIFTGELVLIKNGSIYLRVVSLSFFLTGISQIYICILKNSERAIKSGFISSVSVVINILLNAILIFGLFGFPRMEIAGAALATVISKIIEVLWCVFETFKNDIIKLRIKYILNTDKILRRDFWKYTTPILLNQIFWGIGFSMYSVIMGHLGSDAVAANSIANIIKNLVICFCIGLSNGGSIIVGNELGRGQLTNAKLYGNKLCKLAAVYGVVAGVIMLLLCPFILKLTNLTPESSYYLKWMIIICSMYLVAKSFNTTTIAGIFCAGGDSRFGFICDLITMWCFSVPLGLVFAFVLKLPVLAVYVAINLEEMAKFPAIYKHYKKYNWVKDLTVRN